MSNNEHKLGIDWTQISTAIENAATVGPIQTTTDITTIGSQTLAGDTLLGNFSVGKLSAAFAALRQQGEIKTLLKPSIRLLNNQKGFVKAGDDKTFWSLYSNITINNNSITPQTTTQKIYQGQRQTFGVVLPVTAQISDDGWVTLVIEPARTDLKGTDVSPDGEQTSPTTADQRISTMLRLRDNESAIIGGLSNETSGEQTRGVPGLSAIKFLGLGKLFRTDAKFTTISELVVTVSVKIIQ
ncbi:type II and III secretion system protein (plasmid) [Termitidicoccus mucosus]|uniref:type II secretion system protein GspD n=1 Tax=Termitidicoccus mucosus TaxID=1184151 RepID=UPI003183B9CA